MVNWSGQKVPDEEMFVVRRAAIEMKMVHGACEAEFIHDICQGVVTFDRAGTFGPVGGLFFSADLGEKDGLPNTTTFFIPRSQLKQVRRNDMVVTSTLRVRGNGSISDASYPDDVDTDTARGKGDLRLIIRKEN